MKKKIIIANKRNQRFMIILQNISRRLGGISKVLLRCIHSDELLKPMVNDLPREYVQLEPGINDEIIVAMSSGVDSSVCAALYAQKYRNVRGIYMANWSQTARCTESDWVDVKKICNELNIPSERVNFEKEYWSDVFQPMVQMYERGLTPNPDVGCNKYVKFGKMIEHLTSKFQNNQRWWLVTGHYARIMHYKPSNEFHLLRGFYKPKDQSYYLSNIPKDVLLHVLMPIGHLTKPKVRELASKFNLHIAKKPDSQGLCFVSQDENNFRKFLNEYIEPSPGNIITEDGKVWGRHEGLWHATIGQKLGISMPQGDPKYKGIWFVSEKRFDTNELVIVKGNNNEKLFRKRLRVDEWDWLTDDISTIPNKCKDGKLSVQYRSLQQPEVVKHFLFKDNEIEIELADEARAMAPGQSIVLYENNRVLGSGILKETFI